MAIDLIVVRPYVERGEQRVERITWRHVPDPPPRWTFERRRWRRPKMVQVRAADGPNVQLAVPLPAWCAPSEMEPNRWVWTAAADLAADMAWIEPDEVGADGTKFYAPGSLWWTPYDVPLRAGCVLR